MFVRDVMTEAVATVDLDATIQDVLNTMVGRDVRHVPVVEDGELRGMVSDRDVRSWTQNGERGRSGHASLNESVTAVMECDVISFSSEARLADLVDTMIDHKVGAVPVTSGDQLIGIVSYIDILRIARRELD